MADPASPAGGLDVVSSPAFTAGEVARYHTVGWWSDTTLSDAVRRNAECSPERAAYVDHPDAPLTWCEFDRAADSLAGQLAGVGVSQGERVAVWHHDSAAIHVLFVAIERCGAVVVGIGARAGLVEHLVALGVSKELLPERLVVVDELPRSSGGKIAKGQLVGGYSSQDGGGL